MKKTNRFLYLLLSTVIFEISIPLFISIVGNIFPALGVVFPKKNWFILKPADIQDFILTHPAGIKLAKLH